MFPAMKVRVLCMASLIGGPLMLTSIMLTKMQDMLDQTTMCGDYEDQDPYERDEEEIEADVEAIKRMARWCNYKIFFEVMFLTGFNLTYAHFLFTDWSFLLLMMVNAPYIYLAHSGNRELIFHLTVLSSTEYLKDTGVLAEQRVRFASRMVLQSMFGLQALKVYMMRQLSVAKSTNKPGFLLATIQQKTKVSAKLEGEINYTFDLLDEDRGGNLDVDELVAILTTVGMNLSASDKMYLFGKKLQTISIGRRQWCGLYHEAIKIVDSEPELVSNAMFDWLDEDGGGALSFSELIHKFTHTRVKIRVAELLQILDTMDANGDGEISREELQEFFINFCNNSSHAKPSVRAIGWKRFKQRVRSFFGLDD
jgi:Ca2+-binding EF-hand superfamily protein